jgi:hypothetical protein
MMSAWRAKLGISLIPFMALLALGTLAGYRSVLQQNAGKTDAVTLNEARFEGLRAVLPARGIVGYLSDTDDLENYYLAQYCLAPVVVARDAARDLIVANVKSPTAIAKLASANNLTVVRDFQDGVALLRRNR